MPDLKDVYRVYILSCSDRSYYIGHAKDLQARIQAHDTGRAAAHTRRHRPARLVYVEIQPTRLAAIRRERQIKRWSRAKKEALIKGNHDALRSLSKRRS